MTQIINDLAVTRARRALTEAVGEGRGRIYYEPAAKNAYDRLAGVKVTERVRELLAAEWIRVAEPEERRVGESATRIHYRLTGYGLAALKGEGQ